MSASPAATIVPRRAPAYLGSVAFAVPRTEDAKITLEPRARPVAVTHVTQRSCDTACAFYGPGNGCYASQGNEGRIAMRLNTAADGTAASPLSIANDEAAAIRALHGTAPLRLHVVGDCRTDEAARVVSAAADEYRQRSTDGDVWTYTHAWRNVDRSSWGDVSVLASCETAEDVALATSRGYACELTAPHADLPREVAGLRTIACPQQTGAKKDCESCRLCAKADRLHGKAIIVLNPHGPTRRVAASIARRNVQ